METASPAPTCSSLTSDQSVDGDSKSRMRPGQIPSPCLSFRSDQSMTPPPAFRNENLIAEVHPSVRISKGPSPAPTLASVQSEQLMDIQAVFICGSHWYKPNSPAASYSSMASEQSMDPPLKFSRLIDVSGTYKAPSPAPTLASVQSEQSMDPPATFSCRESYRSLMMKDHLRCSVCKEMLKEPVSIPCGHSFCKPCILSYWKKPARALSFSCPQCRKRFKTRPALNLNFALANVVQTQQQASLSPALLTGSDAGPGDVACDLCTGSKMRAVKWCLTCSVAYCETHVRQHYTVEALQRHTLTDVTEDLETRTCPQHHGPLEIFCKTDQVFICLVCVMVGHKDHDTLPAKSERHTAKEKFTADLHQILRECKMEITRLLKHNEELTAKVKALERAESAQSHLTKHFCRGLRDATVSDFTSEVVEVAALGRQLDLGMLHDNEF